MGVRIRRVEFRENVVLDCNDICFLYVSIIYNAKAIESEKITEANNSNKVAQQCKESQLAGDKPVGNLKV